MKLNFFNLSRVTIKHDLRFYMAGLEYFSNKEFVSIDYSKIKFVIGEYDNCKFIDCKFSNSFLSESIFINCEFINVEFVKCNISAVVFRDTNFIKCNLSGIQFDTCNQLLLSFTFNKCKLNMASYYGMKLHRMEFNDCEMIEVDFGNADLTSSTFKNCNLNKAIFENTNLSKSDFRSAINYAIDPEQNKITQAKFSLPEVVGLLSNYNIIIEN
jgi:fluoroquinolone resistance protein